MAKGNKTKKSRMSGVGAKIQDLAGKAVRGAYRKATPQLQVANKIAQFVKPESGIAKAIKSVAQPTLPSGGKKSSKANATPVKKSTKKVLRAFDPKNNNAARRKSSKGKVGKNRESKTSNFDTVMTTMRMPGEAIAPKTKRMPARMKGGGAVKAKGMARGGMMKSKGMARGGMMKSKGMKAGGMMKTKGYARGGAVNKRKATGAAKRGFGKAYMKGKR